MMNHRSICLIIHCLTGVLVFTGCGSADRTLIPATGAGSTVPSVIEAARGTVWEYVRSSSRISGVPADLEWQLDEEQYAGEIRYRSGGWCMVIWPAASAKGNQRVVIFNPSEDVYWGGYVTPGGVVVDTSSTP